MGQIGRAYRKYQLCLRQVHFLLQETTSRETDQEQGCMQTVVQAVALYLHNNIHETQSVC